MCDVCERTVQEGVTLLGCRSCEYDECFCPESCFAYASKIGFLSKLVGKWASSKGGVVNITKDGDSIVIENPPVKEFRICVNEFRDDLTLNYLYHKGKLVDGNITWSNGTKWTRMVKDFLWLELKGRDLVINEEGMAVMKAEQDYVNAIMVCGRLRTGKSYLMNALLGSNAFDVSSQAHPLTEGVRICADVVPGSHFGWSRNRPKLAFLDIEGQGDKGIKHDVKVATPALLISKVVILNEVCPTGPSKEGILSLLQVMMHAALQVPQCKDRNGLFGCLHIVLRDCCQDEALCQDIIFADENPSNASTDDQAEAMKMRNDTREAIRQSFEAPVKVWCLPRLSCSTAPEQYRSADPGYVAKIDEMREYFRKQLRYPKMLGGMNLTGIRIASVMPAISKAICSDHPALNPPSIAEAVWGMEALSIERRISDQAHSHLHEVNRKLPMEPAQLEPWNRECKRHWLIRLQEEMKDIPSPAVVAKARETFCTKLDTDVEHLTSMNEKLLTLKKLHEAKTAAGLEKAARVEAEKGRQAAEAMLVKFQQEIAVRMRFSAKDAGYPQPPGTDSSTGSSTDSSTGDGKFYKGGQFVPGGGRAPRGGCYIGGTGGGGGKFYAGGQFMPGGGRAPKGGCYK